jgi:hypothetical protein
MDVVRDLLRKSSDDARGNNVVDSARILGPLILRVTEIAHCRISRDWFFGDIMERYMVLAGHVTFAVIAIWLLALVAVAAEVQLSGGNILVLTDSPM